MLRQHFPIVNLTSKYICPAGEFKRHAKLWLWLIDWLIDSLIDWLPLWKVGQNVSCSYRLLHAAGGTIKLITPTAGEWSLLTSYNTSLTQLTYVITKYVWWHDTTGKMALAWWQNWTEYYINQIGLITGRQINTHHKMMARLFCLLIKGASCKYRQWCHD